MKIRFLNRFILGTVIGLLTLGNGTANAKILEDVDSIGKTVYGELSPYVQSKADTFDIHIIEKPISSIKAYEDSADYIAGVITYNKRVIYVSNMHFDFRTTNYTLYHEIGHALDCYDTKGTNKPSAGEYSDTAELKKLMTLESDKLLPLQHELKFKKESREYFAECFAIYMYWKDAKVNLMEKYAPFTYAYIDKIVNKPISE